MGFWLILLSCGGKEASLKTTDSTDFEPHDDTALDTEEGDFPSGPIPSIAVTIEGQYAGFSLSLVVVDFGESSLNLGDTLYHSSQLEGPMLSIELDPPDESVLSETEANGGDNVMLVPIIHRDSNGDGQYSTGEEIAGFSYDWPIYFGPNADGITEGWYQFVFSFDSGIPEFKNSGETLIETKFYPSMSIEGQIQGESTSPSHRVQSIGMLSDGEDSSDPLYSSTVSESTYFSIAEAPRPSMIETYDGEIYAATMTIVGYTDTDESSMMDGEEVIQEQVCFGEKLMILLYLQPPVNLDQAFVIEAGLEFKPVSFGWGFWLLDPLDLQGELQVVDDMATAEWRLRSSCLNSQ
jgi:hypothetical protein